MTAEAYDLDRSRQSVRELYPVLLDAHGNIIDGYHRLDMDPNWRTEKLSHIQTPAQLWAARIIANGCRRDVSRSERTEQFAELARCLSDEGVSRDRVAATISDMTTYSERYVQLLLPAEYKRAYKSDLRSQLEPGHGESELSSELEPGQGKSDLRSQLGASQGERELSSELEASRGKSDLRSQLAADGQVTVPTEHRPGAEPVAHEAAQPGTPGPTQHSPADAGVGAPGHSGPKETREEALDYIRRYHDKHPKPDAEYLSWEVAINVGVSEKTALELIGLVQRERGIAEQGKSSVAGPIRGSVTCPLCSREGAERGMILGRVQDPQLGQLTLWEFVMEEMR